MGTLSAQGVYHALMTKSRLTATPQQQQIQNTKIQQQQMYWCNSPDPKIWPYPRPFKILINKWKIHDNKRCMRDVLLRKKTPKVTTDHKHY